MLNTAFIKIYRLIIKDRIWHREQKERERQAEERRIKYEELEKAWQQSLREQALEEERRQKFIKEAEDWHNANKLYQYIAHINSLLPNTGLAENPAYVEWKRWALKVAEDIDPTASRLLQSSNTGSSGEEG